jgi:hypothetical protein
MRIRQAVSAEANWTRQLGADRALGSGRSPSPGHLLISAALGQQTPTATLGSELNR